MNKELFEAVAILEKEKNIDREILLDAIENSLVKAFSKTRSGKEPHVGKAENVRAQIDRETCDIRVFAEKTVAETVENEGLEISLDEARKLDAHYNVGDVVQIPINSRELSRIAAKDARDLIIQKIHEEERRSLYEMYLAKKDEVVTGIVQRYMGKNISINLGKADAMLGEKDQVKGENLRISDRIKVFVADVQNTSKGPRIVVSRTRPELVYRLFEAEVAEVKDGTVEIRGMAREAGSRTKMSVWSNDPNVDAVGACVGVNGARVNAIVNELRGEKIDIINWSDNSALLIENALSPAKVICVIADDDERVAQVVVPDYQLSLAIGKEGQNARLAAKLTGYKIDIKSETQARESGLLEEIGYDASMSGEYDDYGDIYYDDGYEEYEEGYDGADEDGGYPDAEEEPAEEGMPEE